MFVRHKYAQQHFCVVDLDDIMPDMTNKKMTFTGTDYGQTLILSKQALQS